MKRGLWTYVAIAVVTIMVLAAAGALGVFYYYQQRNARWLSEGMAAYESGDWNKARDNLRSYIPQDRGNVDLLNKFADACLHIVENRTAALREAATAYLEILQYEPDNGPVREKLYDIYADLGEWSTIEYYANEWLNRDGDNDTYRFWLAKALERMQRRDEAIKEYQTLADTNTDVTETYGALAGLLRDRGDERLAAQVFDRALETHEDDARVHVDYARYLARTEDWEQVNAQLDRAVELAPDDPYVLMAQAQAMMLNQDYEQALATAQKAVDHDPAYSEAYLFIANLQFLSGNPQEAIDTLSNVDPLVQLDDSYLLLTLVDYLFETKRLDEADRAVKRYIAAFPENLTIQDYFSARALLAQGEAAAAVERLAPVVELRPDFSMGRFALAKAYVEAGELDLGRAELESYIERNPGDQRARIFLARQFGEAYSLPELTAQVRSAMADDTTSAQRLVALARALMETAARENRYDTEADRIRELLVRATERDPRYAPGYTTLVDHLVRQRDLARAKEVLTFGETAGVPSEELALSRADVALAEGDRDAARAVRDEALASAASIQPFVTWKTFFLRRGLPALALETLDMGMDGITDPKQQTDTAIQRAMLLAQLGRPEEAMQTLAGLSETGVQASAVKAAKQDLALILLQQDFASAHNQAEAVWQAMDETERQSAGGFALQGWISLTGGDPVAARTAFDAALGQAPGNEAALLGLSRLEEEVGDEVAALRHAEEATRGATSPEAVLRVADLQMRLGQTRKAERNLSRILAINPNHPDALSLMIRLQAESGQADRARTLLDRLSAAVDPNSAALKEAKARVALVTAPLPEVEQALREQVASNPDDKDAVKNLAAALMRQDKFADAEALLKSFAEGHTDDPDALVMLAGFYSIRPGTDQLELASSALTRALLIDPAYLPALRDMIQVRLRQGNPTDALSLCDRYLTQSPDNEDILHIKAMLLGDLGRNDEALNMIETALSIDARPEFRAARGMIYTNMQEYDKALHDLEFVAALRDPSAQVELALAEALQAKGRTDEARARAQAATEKFKQGQFVNKARLDKLNTSLGIGG